MTVSVTLDSSCSFVFFGYMYALEKVKRIKLNSEKVTDRRLHKQESILCQT